MTTTGPAFPFTDSARQLLPRLRDLRRRLHAIPEIGLELPGTQQTILGAIEDLPLEITQGTAISSVTAVLRGAKPGPTVLLRGDMDALPVREATGLDYASTNGAMHACGHDLHMTGLVGAAHLLCARRDELPGAVIFMFQPGEEGHGGGQIMVEEGVLEVTGDKAVAAYGIHVDGTTPMGHFLTRPGPLMAGVDALSVSIIGSGGHAASPHLAIDPVPVAAEIVLAVQGFVTRRIRATDPAVVSIGQLHTDSAAGNVLAREVQLSVNMRHFSQETESLLLQELPHMIRRIAEAHGCQARIDHIPSYPATVNDPAETHVVLEQLSETFGEDRVHIMPEPAMASEDFSYVLQQVPGAFVFLGAKPEHIHDGDSAPMHSETVIFDDEVLADQAAALAGFAWHRLLKETQE